MKFLKFLGVFVLLFTFFVPVVHAQSVCDIPGINSDACKAIDLLFTKKQADGPWYNQNFGQFSKKVLDKSNPDAIFGERYTFAQINWIVNSIATMLNPAANIQNAGDLFNFINEVQKLLKAEAPPTMSGYAKLGPAGLFAGGITALYSNPPASAVSETKYVASRIFDFSTGTTPVYAAEGYGYAGLNSGGAVRALWTASRNMSYLIIVIILIASGFMIMFRVKINPQTVVSLQTMIPKLVTTLILITFSFAIAGLVIDMIYVFIAAIVGIMGTTGGLIATRSIPSTISWLTSSEFPSYIALQIGSIVMFPFFMMIGGFLFLGWGGVGIFNVLGGLVGAVIGIILCIWGFIILTKILLMLIKAYVTLLLSIAIGPLQIMLDLIPGQSGFGPWIRNIIATASVFVVVPVMLIIQHLFSWSIITNNVLGLVDYNALGNDKLALPFLNGALKDTDILMRMIIGYTIFSMTPKIADIVRDLLKIPPFKYGADFGGLTVGLGYAQGKLKGVYEDPTKSAQAKGLAKAGMNAIDLINAGKK